MTHESRLREILVWLLEGQTEHNLEAVARQVGAERLGEATRIRAFTDTEKRALLTSPSARLRLRVQAEARRAERIVRWRELAVDGSLALCAAAGGPSRAVTVRNDDFVLSALPMDDAGSQWLLHLRVSPRLRSELQGHRLRVCDDVGAVWLDGTPDQDGELSAVWALDGSPSERLASRRLAVEPA
jgi:hypothetical protein